jgi:hypothetical protein
VISHLFIVDISQTKSWSKLDSFVFRKVSSCGNEALRDNMKDFEWQQLCQAALVELDPQKLLERIAEARTAVLKQMDFSQSDEPPLRAALGLLGTLRRVAKREIDHKTAD